MAHDEDPIAALHPESDDLAPSRGLLNAFLMSAALYAVVAGVFYLLTHHK